MWFKLLSQWTKSLSVTIKMKAIEQYLHVELLMHATFSHYSA